MADAGLGLARFAERALDRRDARGRADADRLVEDDPAVEHCQPVAPASPRKTRAIASTIGEISRPTMFALGRDHRQDQEEEDEDQQRVAAERREGPGERWRQQPLDDMAAIERRKRDQVEDGEENVDQQEVDRVARDEFERTGRLAVRHRHRDAEDHRPDQGQQAVHPRPGERDQHHVAARVAQPFLDDRHRPCPAENRRMGDGEDHRQDHRPERIDVLQGIERQPPHGRRGRIAQPPRDKPVRDLVKDDGDDRAAPARWRWLR